MLTLTNVETPRGESLPRSVSVAADALPEAVSSQTGVSVRYVAAPEKKWFVLRATYHREVKAADFLIADGTYAYIAQKYVERIVNGKRRRRLVTLVPNLLFVYTTPQQVEQYVRNTPELSYLTFYYDHFTLDREQKNPALTIPEAEMMSFIRATSTRDEHLLFVAPERCHFKSGEMVRVVDGLFKGVEGRVARVCGQQRVVVSLSKIGLVSTAYIPTAFIEPIK